MIPLESGFDPLAFESWEQITALLIIVTGGIVWKWLSSMSSRQKATGETVDQIKSTLTTNNGGSHIKDQLDRIEEIQRKQALLLAADSQKLTDHMAWSESYVRETKDILDRLPCQERVGRHYLDEDHTN